MISTLLYYVAQSADPSAIVPIDFAFVTAVWQFVVAAGVPGLLLLFVVAILRGWVVTGSVHRDAVGRIERTHKEQLTRMDDELTRANREHEYWREAAARMLRAQEESHARP